MPQAAPGRVSFLALALTLRGLPGPPARRWLSTISGAELRAGRPPTRGDLGVLIHRMLSCHKHRKPVQVSHCLPEQPQWPGRPGTWTSLCRGRKPGGPARAA